VVFVADIADLAAKQPCNDRSWWKLGMPLDRRELSLLVCFAGATKVSLLAWPGGAARGQELPLVTDGFPMVR
jgi:hypothetical protein